LGSTYLTLGYRISRFLLMSCWTKICIFTNVSLHRLFACSL